MTRGTATGNLVAGQKVNGVITGHIGRKSKDILRGAGIKVYLGATGTVEAVIALFKEGKLEKA
ncbi:MAG TPA: hypothetical protein ENO00_12435 [Deltaproteobacteria bacterium]|nr:hypothetical protein [Deltaproteobacteria bacterium]